MDLMIEEQNWKTDKTKDYDEHAYILYYHPSFNRQDNDNKAFALLRETTGFGSPDFFRSCAQRTKHYYLHYKVGSVLTSYVKVLEDLCDHLNKNFLIAIQPGSS